MITNFKIYESDDYSKFIGQTPIVNNVDENDQIWMYRKILYYRTIHARYYLCTFSDIADYNYEGGESYIERENKKLYYSAKLRKEFLKYINYNKYLGKTKTDVENLIDNFNISRDVNKYNL